ncbi:MAG: hypothetical protein JXJ04_06070 [Spirochaetales bacterium]|nr:hypothetical protein [Spirochaetales bacterium]
MFKFLTFLFLACVVIFLAAVVDTIIKPEKDFDSLTITFLIMIPLCLVPAWYLIPYTGNMLFRIRFTEDSLVFSRFFAKQSVSYANINKVR